MTDLDALILGLFEGRGGAPAAHIRVGRQLGPFADPPLPLTSERPNTAIVEFSASYPRRQGEMIRLLVSRTTAAEPPLFRIDIAVTPRRYFSLPAQLGGSAARPS